MIIDLCGVHILYNKYEEGIDMASKKHSGDYNIYPLFIFEYMLWCGVWRVYPPSPDI